MTARVVDPVLLSADEVGRLGRRLVRWSEALSLAEVEAARVAERRVARTGCPLSARQVEVLAWFASGEVAGFKEVAARLGVSVKTVRNLLDRAARTLGTSGTTQTVVVALRQGWVSLPAAEVDEAA